MPQHYAERAALHDRMVQAAEEQGKKLTWECGRMLTEYRIDGEGPLTTGVAARQLGVSLLPFYGGPQ